MIALGVPNMVSCICRFFLSSYNLTHLSSLANLVSSISSALPQISLSLPPSDLKSSSSFFIYTSKQKLDGQKTFGFGNSQNGAWEGSRNGLLKRKIWAGDTPFFSFSSRTNENLVSNFVTFISLMGWEKGYTKRNRTLGIVISSNWSVTWGLANFCTLSTLDYVFAFFETWDSPGLREVGPFLGKEKGDDLREAGIQNCLLERG